MSAESRPENNARHSGNVAPLILYQDIQGPERIITFDGDRFTVGRDEGADFVIDPIFSTVSPLHLSFSRREGGWVLQDEGSVNGTLLNNVKVQPHVPYLLHEADVMSIEAVHEYAYNRDEPPKKGFAPDGTQIVKNPDPSWRLNFVCLGTLREKFRDYADDAMLKCGRDGNLCANINIIPKEDLFAHKYAACEGCALLKFTPDFSLPASGRRRHLFRRHGRHGHHDLSVSAPARPENCPIITEREKLGCDEDGKPYCSVACWAELKRNTVKQCPHCGAFAGQPAETRCPHCGQPLPDENHGYFDPVVLSTPYKSVDEEVSTIISRMIPKTVFGMGIAVYYQRQQLLKEWCHIIYRTPDEMNPSIIIE